MLPLRGPLLSGLLQRMARRRATTTALRLWVATDRARGSDIEANANVTLVGSRSQAALLLVPPNGEFARDSCLQFRHSLARDLGQLQYLDVAVTKPGGWLLDKILVAATTYDDASSSSSLSPPTSTSPPILYAEDRAPPPTVLPPHATHVVEQRYVFPCNQWIGSDENDSQLGKPIRLVGRPATSKDQFDELYAHTQASHAGPTAAAADSALTTLPLTRSEPSPLKIRHSAFTIPRPSKSKAASTPSTTAAAEGRRFYSNKTEGLAGEDAYAVYVASRGAVVAVADGVQSWMTYGINSGDVALGLVKQICNLFAAAIDAPTNHYLFKPQALLSKAWEVVRQQGLQGSTTVALITIDCRRGVVRSSLLGDSGYIIFRGLDTDAPYRLFATPQQEHEFGMPFQLGHHAGSDKPEDAITSNVQIQRGDVIVAGTDGLFDNLGEMAMAAILQQSRNRWMAARNLAFAAFEVSVDPNAVSPWSRWATHELNMPYVGGKADDITVVVAEAY